MKANPCLASVLALAFGMNEAWGESPISLDGVKCVVNPIVSAKRDVALDYHGGKIYFCCEGCRRTFEKESDKFTAQANLQLVQTKQAQQTRCPISGQVSTSANKVSFQGIEVAFCCDGCRKVFEEATADEKLRLAFADKAFVNAFRTVNGTSSSANLNLQPHRHEIDGDTSPLASQPRAGESVTRTRAAVRGRGFRRR